MQMMKVQLFQGILSRCTLVKSDEGIPQPGLAEEIPGGCEK